MPPFEHERAIGEQYELIGYLSRSAWALGAGAVLLLLSGIFAQSNGPSPWMVGAGVVMALLAVVAHRYARGLDARRKAALDEDRRGELGRR